MMTYMTHSMHGVHIAYGDDEVKRCEKNGWIVYGASPPPAGYKPKQVDEPVKRVEAVPQVIPPKRGPGRPRKDK